MLNAAYHFACPIYYAEHPEFLNSVSQVSEEELAKAHKEKKVDNIYPAMMTGNYYEDPRIEKFVNFVGKTSWNILNEQGYNMQNLDVMFTEMWTQEHYKHSLMEQHVHGYGSQIVGFYFLEAPENSSRVVFHDPRPGKVQIDLYEKDNSMATIASQMINFEPKPGLLIFTNSWLAHSFTRHASDKPIKFVHFNLTVTQAQQNFGMKPADDII
jgi:uncharacterized protein (TIGR02466 family)